MNILLAIDGSNASRRMLTYVASNSLVFRPEHHYTLLSVIGDEAGRAPAEAELREASRFLKEQAGVHGRLAVRLGRPAAAIVEMARRHEQNLIVLGSRGHGRAAALVLGSVAQEVLTTTHVPVLVVP